MDYAQDVYDRMIFGDGPEPDPDDIGTGPRCDRIVATVVWVKETKNKEGKTAAVMCVEDVAGDEEPFCVRSVKLANEIVKLKPGERIDLSFLIHDNLDGTCFRNVVFAKKIVDGGTPAGSMNPNERDVVLSVDAPQVAFARLIDERVRRGRTFWTQRDGTLIDVSEMSDEHLDNTITMLERVLNLRSMAEEACGGGDGED